jgi:hypothetical protein
MSGLSRNPPLPRFRWRCSRCARDCDEPVRYGWGPAWSSCGQTIALFVRPELDRRVVSVQAPASDERASRTHR